MREMASAGPTGYRPLDGCWDEAFEPGGALRAQYRDLIARLGAYDLERLQADFQRAAARAGIEFRTANGRQPFLVDPVPRIILAKEWSPIARGVEQRARALNAFVHDAYGERRIVDAGVVPAAVIDSAQGFEPDMGGVALPGGVFTHVCGLDLVRCEDGVIRVLEDNVRSPSGFTFAAAARRVGDELLGSEGASGRLGIDGDLQALAAALHAADPVGDGDPAIVLATDGPQSAAWYEHRTLAEQLEIPLVSFERFERRGDRVGYRNGNRLEPVEVIYRRTELDRLRAADGKLTAWGELLLEPLQAGTVASVNAFGTGVADDKLTHAYLDRIIRFYLDQEPLLESVQTFDPAEDDSVLERLSELVVKPRDGLGSKGIVIGAGADEHELERVRSQIAADPGGWIAQETVSLSAHPTVVNGVLAPRRIDLRPYAVLTDDRVMALNGCLTRVALEAGGLIVNSSASGGGKDTWVVTT